MVRRRFALDDQIKVAKSCIDDFLLPFSVGIAVDQDVIRFDICQIWRSAPSIGIDAITFQVGDNTKVNPLFVVKLLYRLTYLSQNLLASCCWKFRVALDHSKEGTIEVGKHQHTFFFVAISVCSKSTGAREFRSKALGQIVKLPGHALDNKGLVSRA